MSIFLSAEWRHLLMLNYPVDPALLRPYVPHGVELDTWNGQTYVSVVGFHFLRTRVLGIPMPGHSNFPEVNLRFYVRRKAPDGWRRGVVFIKEIVPRALIATVARRCYNEPYVALPMRHRVSLKNDRLHDGAGLQYEWQHASQWHSLSASVTGAPQPLATGSEEEFITEHYWGYTAQSDGGCKEYQVEHPRWNIWQTREAAFSCDVAAMYGRAFVVPLSVPPTSAFVAEGSPIAVSTGTRL